MRVQVNKSTDQTKAAPADMSEYGRSRRKRVPKLCDCCGPNGKPHTPGHDPVTKKRGRRKKGVDVTSENTSPCAAAAAAAALEPVSRTHHDDMSVCDVQQVTLSEGTPILIEEQIVASVADMPSLHNGTAPDRENVDHDISNTDPVSITDPKRGGSERLVVVDVHNKHVDGPTYNNEDVRDDPPADAEAMEVEHTAPSAYLNIKALRDHRYCKWPHSASEEQDTHSAPSPSTQVQQDDLVELLHGMTEVIRQNLTQSFGIYSICTIILY